MSIREMDKVLVCRYCKRDEFDGIEHGVGQGVYYGNDDWDVEIACLWPCRHPVQDIESCCPVCNPVESSW